jgi:hypothetical protein
MDAREKVELAMALTNSEAAGRVAISGIVGICNELARLGALDASAVSRIKQFMLLSTERSGASPHMQAHVSSQVEEHFGELIERLDKGTFQPGSMT